MSTEPFPVEVDRVTKEFPTSGGPVRAVDSVSFAAPEGSAVAIIGPNGAGKSTVLKLIAGVLVPTSGTIRRSRSCASLLELGAGFHPDLTGRENLDLSMTLALPSRSERRRRRPEAIEFAGLGDAIDLPVKHMSNGMIGRLACAVAINTSPRLLLIDEVLAVGDSTFQREMLSRVSELQLEGTTLLLVTHSPELAAVATTRAIWLDNGVVVDDGPTHEVLTRYEALVRGWGRSFAQRSVSIERVALYPEKVESGDPLNIAASLRCTSHTDSLRLRLEVRPIVGDDTVWMRSADESVEMRHLNLVAATSSAVVPRLGPGRHTVEIMIEKLPITPTALELSLVLSGADELIIDEVSCELDVGAMTLRPGYRFDVDVVSRSDSRSGATR